MWWINRITRACQAAVRKSWPRCSTWEKEKINKKCRCQLQPWCLSSSWVNVLPNLDWTKAHTPLPKRFAIFGFEWHFRVNLNIAERNFIWPFAKTFECLFNQNPRKVGFDHSLEFIAVTFQKKKKSTLWWTLPWIHNHYYKYFTFSITILVWFFSFKKIRWAREKKQGQSQNNINKFVSKSWLASLI